MYALFVSSNIREYLHVCLYLAIYVNICMYAQIQTVSRHILQVSFCIQAYSARISLYQEIYVNICMYA